MDFMVVQMILSVLIFFVMFFGIAFLLNMLLRMTWFMAILYPVVVVLIIDEVGFFDYFTESGTAFSALGDKIISLHAADIIILVSGLAGSIVAGIVIKFLRKNGYQMF
ncbi:YuiB-like putative membrane protein [Psychrobacillus insolitus]|uniref:YuiB-like putative membrane protein n=1 Tax=Psychrobacillus insolitus TaxID=1461 RepID=A0A2W7PCE0_9BACI|nr:YuiB family protein [Psychrobacillus insolitus]PZX04779.1 YuiB-like putative membrane protein [Psychrobacillus insolitus]